MQLKRLEIFGFKSFADPFVMDFQPGISALVGPNGCGKSNVADALRWVLGTQSARQIRADVMDDVIFKGSPKRKPLGMAEVTVTFDNGDRSLPLDFDEISVTRRLFRSGASEYLINGSRCRLMDITDLIVDRGLGSAGYWILEAEMVKTILSPRAEDRRELFDEAAGIGRYKIQRHRAGLKLETAGEDLERLSDIIFEVEKSHGNLRRQVSAFKRHEKAENTIRQIRAALASGELQALSERLAAAEKELEESVSLQASRAAALTSLETALSEARMRLGEAQGRLDEAHSKRSGLDGEIAGLEKERAVLQERTAASRRTALENRARSARERERIRRYEEEARRAEAELARWEKTAEEARTGAERASKEAEAAAEEVRKGTELLDRARDEEKRCADALGEIRARYTEEVRAYETRRHRALELARRIGESREESGRLSGRLKELCGEIEEVSLERERVARELKAAEAGFEEARRNASETARRAGEAGAFLEAKREQVANLGKALNDSRSGDSLGASIEPSPGMASAVGACLDGFQSARPVREISPDLPGEGSRYAVGGRKGLEETPEGGIRMDSFLEAPDPVAESVLSHYILAPDIHTALEWFESRIQAGIVTPEGHLFRPDGTARLGVSPGGPGTLEILTAVEEGEKLVSSLADQAAALEVKREEAGKALQEAEKTVDRLRARHSALESRTAVLESGKTSIEASLEALESGLLSMEQELRANPCGGDDSVTPDPDLSIRETEEKLAALSLAAGRASLALDELRDRGSRLSMAGERAEMEVREARNRVSQIRARVSELNGEAEAAAAAEEEMREESDTLLRRADAMEKESEALSSKISSLEKERAEAEKDRARAAETRTGLLQKTSSLEEKTGAARDLHGAVRERKSRALSETSALSEQVARLRREAPKADPDNPFVGRDPEDLRDQEARQLKTIEGIGPVNMLAVREYDEIEDRLRFLTEQRRDLEEARDSLKTAIAEINREAQTRFSETFSKVREHFREVFVELFGGGEADITALEAEDPLEGGVQIMARPRGKKLENVTSLSGGERALAAVALLFSLYLVKPSPFCILDELDAPLDDANIDSFMGILRRFSADTQFLIMTHNKRTMQGADRLYGVTMAEEGVSNMTTVSLSDYS